MKATKNNFLCTFIIPWSLRSSVFLPYWQVCTWQWKAGHTQHSWGVSESFKLPDFLWQAEEGKFLDRAHACANTQIKRGGKSKERSQLLSHYGDERRGATLLFAEMTSGETPVTSTRVLKYDITALSHSWDSRRIKCQLLLATKTASHENCTQTHPI